jgi:hypothetical protein
MPICGRSAWLPVAHCVPLERTLTFISRATTHQVMIFTPALNVSAQSDPVSVLEQFIGARNQADEPGAMALVADDIRYVGGSACLLANPCIGPQALRAEVHLFISDHSRSIMIGSALVSGTTVTARAETSDLRDRRLWQESMTKRLRS